MELRWEIFHAALQRSDGPASILYVMHFNFYRLYDFLSIAVR